MSAYKNECFIFIFGALFFLMFNWLLPITDPVESNYALAAKEMLIADDYLTPRLYGQYWYDKPVFVYWTIIAAYKLFGVGAFAARAPMAAASGLSLAFMYWFASKLYSKRVAWIGVGVLATSLEFWVVGKIIVTDSFLFLFDSAALGLFFLGLKDGKSNYFALSCGAMGLAVLTKGPVGAVLPVLIAAAYLLWTKQARLLQRLRLLPGALIFLATALPWYAYMTIARGNDFAAGFWGLHNVTRAIVSEHPTDNVFYYYLIVIPLSVMPWTGILLKSVWAQLKERAMDLPHKYMICWIAATILFYSLVATKYLTYTFIALFPCALMTAVYLERMIRRKSGRNAWLLIAAPMGCMIASAGVGSRILLKDDGMGTYAVLAALFIFTLYLRRSGCARLVAGAIAVCLTMILSLGGFALPRFAQTRSSDLLTALPKDPNAKIVIYGDYPTSAVFYSGHAITRLRENADDANPWSNKYTMPTQTIGAFLRSEASNGLVYLILPKHEIPPTLQADVSANYRLVWIGKDNAVYQKQK